jgi:hypothetical protein
MNSLSCDLSAIIGSLSHFADILVLSRRSSSQKSTIRSSLHLIYHLPFPFLFTLANSFFLTKLLITIRQFIPSNIDSSSSVSHAQCDNYSVIRFEWSNSIISQVSSERKILDLLPGERVIIAKIYFCIGVRERSQYYANVLGWILCSRSVDWFDFSAISFDAEILLFNTLEDTISIHNDFLGLFHFLSCFSSERKNICEHLINGPMISEDDLSVSQKEQNEVSGHQMIELTLCQ